MPVLNHRSAWYPYICFISLFSKENPTFYSAIALEAVPAINQSGRPWHTAQLAALTWYITQAVAAPHTPPSSREFHLMLWFCWIWSSRERKSFSMLCSNKNFLWFPMYLEALWGQIDYGTETRGSRKLATTIWRKVSCEINHLKGCMEQMNRTWNILQVWKINVRSRMYGNI